MLTLKFHILFLIHEEIIINKKFFILKSIIISESFTSYISNFYFEKFKLISEFLFLSFFKIKFWKSKKFYIYKLFWKISYSNISSK